MPLWIWVLLTCPSETTSTNAWPADLLKATLPALTPALSVSIPQGAAAFLKMAWRSKSNCGTAISPQLWPEELTCPFRLVESRCLEMLLVPVSLRRAGSGVLGTRCFSVDQGHLGIPFPGPSKLTRTISLSHTCAHMHVCTSMQQLLNCSLKGIWQFSKPSDKIFSLKININLWPYS